MRVRVALSSGLARPLTYEFPGAAGEILPGTRVVVPLGRTLSGGWVLEGESDYRGAARPLIGIVEGAPPHAPFLEFITGLADHFLVSPGLLLDQTLPPGRRPVKSLKFGLPGQADRRLGDCPVAELARLSRAAPLQLRYPGKGFPGFPAVPLSPPPAPPPAPVMVMGDGRFDRFREAMAAARSAGGSVLLVVPDHQSALFWQREIPGLSLYTSALTAAQRNRLWPQLASGGGAVCGNLAALLLPIPDLRLLLVDRAASPLYRWGRSSVDAARAAAIRSRCQGLPLLLGSAGPSLAMALVPAGQCEDRRPEPAPVAVHPVRVGERGVPEALLDLLVEAAGNGERTLVMANRIRAAAAPWCPTCRRAERCPRCNRFLSLGEEGGIACPACSYQTQPPLACSRCGGELAALQPLSLTTLETAVRQRLGQAGLLRLTAEELGDPGAAAAAIRSSRLTLSTPCVLNPFFRRLFDRAVCVRPESLFDLDEYNWAEMIHATLDDMRELLAPGGRLDVFSTFHFHYALQLAHDEKRFLERERKYREWFHLPPFAEVYRLTVRGRSLRDLGAHMRDLHSRRRSDLDVRRISLIDRRPLRGRFRGMIELHGTPAALRETGWLEDRELTVEMVT